ncbi:NUDIX domain-containing protein [Candidatus Woesearchaeota archaeon]|nr:NUDIX domain-containing protein [Candidatus Woesearchaeota archaeon]
MSHLHDKIDFTVEVFIVCGNEVLLRIHDKYKFWLSVGGHIELDEDPCQAAIREVKEEVGLDVTLYHDNSYLLRQDEKYKELIAPCFMNRHRISSTHEHISLVYFGIATTKDLILCDNEKSDGCKWFTSEELDDPVYGVREQVKIYAKRAIAVVGTGRKEA